ncbi:MAG: polyprenyl diphosphate synthase [Patescibacteria group bacterium]|nr:polyprenyl diphosphate synthase [Patescibacteria group bacterium]
MKEKETKKIPKHVGIILDGNRRWAKERNLPTFEGHRQGSEVMRRMPAWFFSCGVEIVSVYAFSTENWKRKQEEVNYLMKLFDKVFGENLEDMNERGYRLLISGRISELPGDLPDICQNAIDQTKNNKKGTLNVCFNYGGRAEIVDALKTMILNGIEANQVHEGMIRKYLYQADLPDPDIIVRTSGEERISGFLLWEASYSEFLFLKKDWPDFERSDAEFVLEEYAKRKRTFGGNK